MDYLQDFLDFTQYVRGRANNTIQGYRFDLREFLTWLQGRGLEPQNVKSTVIDSFLIYLKKEKANSPATVNRKLYCLKNFYKWLLRNDVIQKDPLQYCDRLKEASKLPHYLTPQEQEPLILAAREGTTAQRIGSYARERGYILTLLLLDCGLRIQEACSLKVPDINLEDGTLRITGKGGKERIGILSDRLISALKEYLSKVTEIDLERKNRPGIAARGLKLNDVVRGSGIPWGTVVEIAIANRHKLNRNLDGGRKRELQTFINEKVKPLPLKFLLFNRGGKPLNTRQAFRIVREIGRKAGIEIHPHLLRHSFAINLRRRGGDLMLLKEALGHSSVITTQIYAGFTDGEFKERMRQLVN
jgi:site-specific recombinase XerD